MRSYDTGRSFEPIFMKFTWLVRVHSWVNPIVFGNNRPNRTTDMKENVHAIFKRISRNFEVNFKQFLVEFHSIRKRISHTFQENLRQF